METLPPVSELRECLLDTSRSLGSRNRAAYYLRTIANNESVQALCDAIQNKEDSALIRHELAFVLGQMQTLQATHILESVLSDISDDVMVRHEAAEALGAIGSSSSIPVLSRFVLDPAPEVSETCSLALSLIDYRRQQEEGKNEKQSESDKNPYLTVDPAPSLEKNVPVSELREILLNPNASLFDRYRAMFSLRNRGTEDAVLALGESLMTDNTSCLFRHEIAYVLGQLEHSAAIPALRYALMNPTEHRMVRHEAAESIGSIGGSECERLLEQFRSDQEQVVKESCEVALDAMEYWASLYPKTTTSEEN